MPRLTNRRNLILGATAAVLAGAGAWAMKPDTGGATTGAMTPPEAHRAARAGDILLIDIRRPDEWQQTGVAEGAQPLDMRRDDFIARLTEMAGGDRAMPVAVICARGVRSDRMSSRLRQAGFSTIIDVPEGMMGSLAGPGWLERGLPVRRP